MSEPTLHTCWICGEKSPERHVLVDCAIAEKAKRDAAKRCNATLGEDRVVYQCSRPKGHVGQHRDGNVTAWDQKP